MLCESRRGLFLQKISFSVLGGTRVSAPLRPLVLCIFVSTIHEHPFSWTLPKRHTTTVTAVRRRSRSRTCSVRSLEDGASWTYFWLDGRPRRRRVLWKWRLEAGRQRGSCVLLFDDPTAQSRAVARAFEAGLGLVCAVWMRGPIAPKTKRS